MSLHAIHTNRSGGGTHLFQNLKQSRNNKRPWTLQCRAFKDPQPPSHPFKGTYSKHLASKNPQQNYQVVPLTANHDCSPSTWPSEAARTSLYNSVPVERVDGMYIPIKGHIPDWLQGCFYRNGPGKLEGAHAVFDGAAMIVRFDIDGSSQKIIVSHRFLETTYLNASNYNGGDIKWRLAHEPKAILGSKTPLQKLHYIASLGAAAVRHGLHLGDNALVSIYPQGGHLIAHTETLSGTYKVDPVTLETLERIEYPNDAISGMVKTAHPFQHPSGDVYNLSCDFMPVPTKTNTSLGFRKPHITLFKHPKGDPAIREAVAEVPYLKAQAPTWIHQHPMTENYAIIVQNPVVYSIPDMLFGENNDSLVFDWQPDLGSLIHIVCLSNGDENKIKTLRAPAFLATHWVNGYESKCGRYLYLDACVTDDATLMGHWSLSTMKSGPSGGRQIGKTLLRRLVIDLKAPDGSDITLDNPTEPLLRPLIPDIEHGYAFELPQINPQYSTKEYQFVYGACCKRPSNAWNALCKADIVNHTVQVWSEPGAVCWEPIFVPRPGAVDEDDGVVLSTIMQQDGKSALLVLDAKSWTEIARAVLPYGLPNGFHGCFIDKLQQ